MKKILKIIGLLSILLPVGIVGLGSSIAQATTYTSSDVATHNTQADCWVIVNGNIYNVTSFLSTHPGGAGAITPSCGGDATATFNSGPHSSGSLSSISSLIVGQLATVNPVLTSLTMTPTTPNIVVGGKINLVVTPKDQNGVKFNGSTITYSSNNTAIATVNSSSGVVTGVAIGTATITATATSGSVSVSTTSVVTVSDTVATPLLTSVKINPLNPTVGAGKTIKLAVVARDQNNKKITGATTTFSSSDTSIATVNSDTGVVTGVVVGTATISTNTTFGDKTLSSSTTVKVVDQTLKQNNGNHWGQFKNWFKNWFKKHKYDSRDRDDDSRDFDRNRNGRDD